MAGRRGVLAVTIDTNWPGMRERDLRNGTAALVGDDLLEKLPYLPQILARPGWMLGFLRDRPAVMHYPNVMIPASVRLPAKDVGAMLTESIVDWSDLSWIRAAWPGPIAMKGVLTRMMRAVR